ncbi:glycosyltransferase family 2 protein [Micromonospora psammae]|uniref:glycosyltransferase family 2 protein n=1 Tax=Micromonospora sp. CPCC 205556 TaxID=3122398 RepID=UPI002FF2D2AA
MVSVYNEQTTIAYVLDDLLALELPCPFEVIVVDDGSQDGTAKILAAFRHPQLRVIRHEQNRGKGAALGTGIAAATGTHFLPFDADSEYDAADIPRLMAPVASGRADVVYGARIAGMNTVFSSCWYPVGSWATTWAANILFRSRLKDLHTCLKLVPLAITRQMPLRESGFGADTEITARLLKMGLRPFEVPVSYHGRTRAEGKKIRVRDGVRCLLVLLWVRLSRSVPASTPVGYSKPAFQGRARHPRPVRATPASPDQSSPILVGES